MMWLIAVLKRRMRCDDNDAGVDQGKGDDDNDTDDEHANDDNDLVDRNDEEDYVMH